MFFKRKNIFIECERVDAEITARDNQREKEKNGNPVPSGSGDPTPLPEDRVQGCVGDTQGNLHYFKAVFRERSD